jgi:hypothetical protein
VKYPASILKGKSMKTVSLIFSLLALLLVGVAQASAPSATLAANAYWYVDSALAAASDTLAATDSSTLWTNHVIEPGWEYVLTIGTPTGTGADSTLFQVRVDCKNSSNVVQYRRYTGDTLSGNAPQPVQFSLPFGTTLFGTRATIKLMTISGNGTQVILPAIQLIKRRMVIFSQQWK